MIELTKQVFSKNFMFTQKAASDFNSLLPLMIGFAAVVILAILITLFFSRLGPAKSKIKSKIVVWMLSLGLIGFVVVFFRWQQLGFISKNIFLTVIFIIWLIWLTSIIQFIIFKYPKERDHFLDKQRIRKYLPKAKKKK